MSASPNGTGFGLALEPSGVSVLDLFAGAGGLSLGLRMAFPTSKFMLVDVDPDCVRTLRLNFPEAEVVQGDIRGLDFTRLRATVLAAGPPCQGFSKLNRHRVGDPRNDLVSEIVRATRNTRPQVVVVENVPDFLNSANAEHLKSSLLGLDYIIKSGVLNCADYGVPQIRKRALVIGVCRGLPLPWPEATHSRTPDGTRLSWRTVADAFAMLPTNPDGANWHRPYAARALSDPRYRAIPPGGSRRNLPPDLQLRCWRQTRGYSDVLGRLMWDRPSTTVRTAFFRPEKGRFLHPISDRPITVREAARLQSFPDSFGFPEDLSLESVGRQIGNALPPLVAFAFGRALGRVLTHSRSCSAEQAVQS